MGRPEGSRIHEYAIQTTFSGLELDGWRTIRVRNLNVPLIAVKGGKVRVAGHAAFDWLANPDASATTGRDVAATTLQGDVDEYLAVGSWADHMDLRALKMEPFHAAIKADLDAAATAWRQDGWHVVQQYHTNGKNGHFGCLQPDGIAIRRQEVWAMEATCESPHQRIARYTMHDGVVLAHYKFGQVFSPSKPPMVSRRFYAKGNLVAQLA